MNEPIEMEVLCMLPREPYSVPFRLLAADLRVTQRSIRHALDALKLSGILTFVVSLPQEDLVAHRQGQEVGVRDESWSTAQQMARKHWRKYHADGDRRDSD